MTGKRIIGIDKCEKRGGGGGGTLGCGREWNDGYSWLIAENGMMQNWKRS